MSNSVKIHALAGMRCHNTPHNHRSWLTSALMLSCAIGVSGLQDGVCGERVSVSVEPETTIIRAYDPLLIKINIRNNDEKALTTRGPLANGAGSIRFEMRDKSEKYFREIPGRNEGSWCGGPPMTVTIAPLTCYSVRECCFRAGGPGAAVFFPSPGTFELRVAVLFGEKWIVKSAPIAIEVTAISAAEKLAIEAELDNLEVVIGAPYPMAEFVATIAPLEAKLTDSNLKRTIQWNRAVLDIRLAKDNEEAPRARAKVDELRKRASPVTAEAIALTLANQYGDMENWREAKKILKQFNRSDRLLHFYRLYLDGPKKQQ